MSWCVIRHACVICLLDDCLDVFSCDTRGWLPSGWGACSEVELECGLCSDVEFGEGYKWVGFRGGEVGCSEGGFGDWVSKGGQEDVCAEGPGEDDLACVRVYRRVYSSGKEFVWDRSWDVGELERGLVCGDEGVVKTMCIHAHGDG